MPNNKIKKIMGILTVNSILTIILLFFIRLIYSNFSVLSIISWISINTKLFALFFVLLFLLLLFTVKIQLKLKSKIMNETKPRTRLYLKLLFIIFICYLGAVSSNYFFQYFGLSMNTDETIDWIENYPKQFYAGVLYLSFIYLMLYALIGNIFISTIFGNVFFLLIGYTHFNKLNFRVEPLFPSDFKQFTHLKDVIPMISNSLSLPNIILILILVLGAIFLVKYLPTINFSLWVRGIVLLVSAFMVFSFTYYSKTFMKSFLKMSDISIIKWDQTWNYQANGFLFGFISNIQDSNFPKPKGYSKEKIVEIAKKYEGDSIISKSKLATESPNIIFLMNEAFWDPTSIGKVEFSEDPIKNTRELMSKYPSGKILSPAFGGATANVEFEALTGFTTSFFKPGVIPYQDMVDHKKFVPSIVSNLEVLGYNSLAIHPYDRYFYKRNRVYETFGFDKYLDMDTMKHTKRSGPMISDESVTYEIIDNISKSKDPIFIHAITMQNHLPYNTGRYEKNTIKISGLSVKATEELEVYTEGVKQADDALQLLVNKIEELDEPTIVFFWGDHLPALGKDRAVYKEAEFFNKNLNKDLKEKKYSETPLLIYSNLPIENQELGTISPTYLSTIVYELMGHGKPPFYHFLDELRTELPGIKTKLKINSQQKVIYQLNEKQKQLLEEYRIIQYDLLVGKQYGESVLFQ